MRENTMQHLGEGKRRKPFDPVQFVIRRGPLIIVAGLLLSALFAVVLVPMGKPVFEVESTLLIDPTKEQTLSGRERDLIPGNIGDWTRTQIARVLSRDVMEQALPRVPQEQWPDFFHENPRHPSNVFRLMKRVRVREVPRTYLVALQLRHDNPDGIAPMLNAVMEAYIEKLQVELEDSFARRLEYLIDERDKIQDRLLIEEQRLMELAEGVETKAFLHEGYNVHLSKVEQIQRLYWEAFAHQTEAMAHLEKVQQDRERILAMDLKPFADERVADNFGINRIEQWTYEQLQQMRASIDGLTVDNLDRQYVEARMQAMNNYLAEYKNRVTEETFTNLDEKRRHEQEVLALMALTAADSATAAAASLGVRLEEARTEAARTSIAIFSASDPVYTRNQLRDRIQALNNRIDDTEMEAKTPLRIRIDKRADPPSRPVSTSHSQFFMMAVVLGFGIVTAAMLLYELLDDRIRSAREIELALGGPGPDPVTAFVADVHERPDFICATLDDPGHPATVAIRDLAGRLDHDRRRFQGALYALAGLQPRAGATTLGVNLAHSIRALEGSALLVELNLERPGLRAALELPGGPGIETWLRGEATLAEVTRTDPRRGIRVIYADGSGRPDDIHRITSMIAELREANPITLIDAGSFPDDLASFIARQVDGVILVARRKQTRFADLRRRLDLLVQAHVPAVTAILNFSLDPGVNRRSPIGQAIQFISDFASKILTRLRQRIVRS